MKLLSCLFLHLFIQRSWYHLLIAMEARFRSRDNLRTNSSVSFQTVTNLNFFRILLFFHILKAYVRIYQLAKFRVLLLINLWIIADSNSVQIVLSPLEKIHSVLNPAPRACAQGVSDSCSHRRAYKRNTLNAVSYSHKPK